MPIRYLKPIPPKAPKGAEDPHALPDGWPEFGVFEDERVPLRGLADRVPQTVLDDVRVVIGGVEQRPFRQVDVLTFPDDKTFMIS